MSSSENKKTKEAWNYSYIEQRLQQELRFGKEYKTKVMDEKYLKTAEYLMHRIPVYRPTPIFEIDLQDLSVELRQQLITCPEERVVRWIVKAVGLLFDEINTTYYRASVQKLLRVKFVNRDESEKLVEQNKHGQFNINEKLIQYMNPTNLLKTAEEREYEKLTRYAMDYKNNLKEGDLDDIEYISDIISREVKNEPKLTKQILLTLASTYTQEPINLTIHGNSGEGKSYVLGKITTLFPKDDIWQVTGMSAKAIFHRKGKSVYTNPITGKEENADELMSNLRTQKTLLERKKKKLDESGTDNEEVEDINESIREISSQIDEVKNNVRKIIDLSHKVIIFLDTPKFETIENILPVLSHDKHESEYQYTDSDSSGLKTKVNILRGWPTVIFCQAINSEHEPRYKEMSRRFVTVNPTANRIKYEAAIDHATKVFGLSSLQYEEEVVSKEQKDIAKGMILLLKEQLLDIAHKSSPGIRDCIIPYYESVSRGSDNTKAEHMTMTVRVMSWCQMVTFMNINKRPRLVAVDSRLPEGEREESKIPISIFSDLEQAMEFSEYASSGVDPSAFTFFCTVFMVCWNNKPEHDRDSKYDKKSGENIEEERKMLSTKELVEEYKRVTGNKDMTAKVLKRNFLVNLMEHQYIEEVVSIVDRREKKFFPVFTFTGYENRDEWGENRYNPQNLLNKKLVVKNISSFPNKEHLIDKIQQEIKTRENKSWTAKVYDAPEKFDPLKPFNNGSEMTMDQLMEKYYKDPSKCFEDPETTEKQESIDNTINNNNNYNSNITIDNNIKINSEKNGLDINSSHNPYLNEFLNTGRSNNKDENEGKGQDTT